MHNNNLAVARMQSSLWHNNWLVRQNKLIETKFNYIMDDWQKDNQELLASFSEFKGYPPYNIIIALMWQQGIPQQFEKENR